MTPETWTARIAAAFDADELDGFLERHRAELSAHPEALAYAERLRDLQRGVTALRAAPLPAPRPRPVRAIRFRVTALAGAMLAVLAVVAGLLQSDPGEMVPPGGGVTIREARLGDRPADMIILETEPAAAITVVWLYGKDAHGHP